MRNLNPSSLPNSSSWPTRRATAVQALFSRTLQPLRQWVSSLPISSPGQARYIAKTIPAQCPFERDLQLFGRTLAHIPPLCKLNPLYEEVVALRFRALCYLADECGEDITAFI